MNSFTGKRKGRPVLERKYGYFKCHKCNKSWESAYTWVIKGTDKVHFKQECKKCKIIIIIIYIYI
jgi:hypothetical protein